MLTKGHGNVGRPVKTLLTASRLFPALSNLLLEVLVGLANQMVGFLLYLSVGQHRKVLYGVTKEAAVKYVQFDLKNPFARQVVFEGDVLILNLLCRIAL